MAATTEIDPFLVAMLVCPVTRSQLTQEGEFLVGELGGLKFPITDRIPRLLVDQAILPDGYDNLEDFKAAFPPVVEEEPEVEEAEEVEASAEDAESEEVTEEEKEEE